MKAHSQNIILYVLILISLIVIIGFISSYHQVYSDADLKKTGQQHTPELNLEISIHNIH